MLFLTKLLKFNYKLRNSYTLRKRAKLTKLFYKNPYDSLKKIYLLVNLLNVPIRLLQRKTTIRKRWLKN